MSERSALPSLLCDLAAEHAPAPAHLQEALQAVLDGEGNEAQLGALLMGLRLAQVDAALLVAGAHALRSRMRGIDLGPDLVDVCGAGGDGAGLLNISTAVSFVLAGSGVRVAKHGNRAMTSRSGAADVLEAAGVFLVDQPGALRDMLEATNLCFLFAQAHHPGLARLAGPRRALGFRTLFNLLGPLANPAGAKRQLLGVFDAGLLDAVAAALAALGCEHAWVVHGEGGLDELSLSGPSEVVALGNGRMRRFHVRPQDAGLSPAPLEALRGGEPAQNAEALRAVLRGEASAYRDAVLLNAAAALIVAGRAETLQDGAAIAAQAIASGAAEQVLARTIALSQARAP